MGKLHAVSTSAKWLGARGWAGDTEEKGEQCSKEEHKQRPRGNMWAVVKSRACSSSRLAGHTQGRSIRNPQRDGGGEVGIRIKRRTRAGVERRSSESHAGRRIHGQT